MTTPQDAALMPESDASETVAPTIRQLIAVLALLNAGVATYLHLWKLGFMGALSCGAGHGCEMVQLSSWGWFLGFDVALIGAGLMAAMVWAPWIGSSVR